MISRWRSVTLLAALFTTLLAGSTCNPTFPTVTDTTPRPWVGPVNSTKVFSAATTNAANFRVMLQFSRHRWVPSAHEFIVAPGAGNPNIFVFSVSDPASFVNTQRVFYRWLVLGRGPNDLDTVYAQTPDLELQIGCGAGQTTTDLRADQTAVVGMLGSLTTLSNLTDVAALAATGYAVPTHGWASLAGMGVAFGRLPALAGAIGGAGPIGTPTLGSPGLLLYAPAPGRDARDADPDFPYTLTGWAHGSDFNPAVRPTLACFPFDQWFLHEAGWHELNGNFTPTPPAETTLGTGIINQPPLCVPPLCVPRAWHPRIWDMHVWLDTATGVPALGITHPTMAMPGWPTGAGFFPLPLAP